MPTGYDDTQGMCVEEAPRLAVDGEVGVVKPRVIRPELEARREEAEDLHRGRRQYEEPQQQECRAVDIANRISFPRMASDPRNTQYPWR